MFKIQLVILYFKINYFKIYKYYRFSIGNPKVELK